MRLNESMKSDEAIGRSWHMYACWWSVRPAHKIRHHHHHSLHPTPSSSQRSVCLYNMTLVWRLKLADLLVVVLNRSRSSYGCLQIETRASK